VSTAKYQLVCGTSILGELSLVDRDQAWEECQFTPTEAFASVQTLFARELSLLEGSPQFDAEAWESVWDEIRKTGVRLRSSDGTEFSDFVLHIHDDGTARLRV
jgi:hypothetical protein